MSHMWKIKESNMLILYIFIREIIFLLELLKILEFAILKFYVKYD